VLEQASARALRGLGVRPDDAAAVAALLGRTQARSANAAAFTAAYLRYCWPTDELAGMRVAPFQLLASEGAVYHDRPHLWHLDVADRLVAAAPDLIATTRRIAVDVADPASVAAATQWWQELTDSGGEGMVVKPAANLTRNDAPVQPAPVQPAPVQPAPVQPGPGRSGLVQPGLKVRGREYLRIIYGPDYTEPANLARLRQRAVGHKRSLALREYALGLEALDRVARGEPIWRVHECVFAVLALESEPVDPRL
jgi:protein phosphatase